MGPGGPPMGQPPPQMSQSQFSGYGGPVSPDVQARRAMDNLGGRGEMVRLPPIGVEDVLHLFAASHQRVRDQAPMAIAGRRFRAQDGDPLGARALDEPTERGVERGRLHVVGEAADRSR